MERRNDVKGNGRGNGRAGRVALPRCLKTWTNRTRNDAKDDEHRCLLRAEGWVRLMAKLRRRAAKRHRWARQTYRSMKVDRRTRSGFAPRYAMGEEVSAWTRNARNLEIESERAQVHALKQLDEARKYRQEALRYEQKGYEGAGQVLELFEPSSTAKVVDTFQATFGLTFERTPRLGELDA
jgi:hypothetical protein